MVIALTLSILFFVSYIGFIVYKYGIQTSISASYYILPPNKQFLFSIFCILYPFPIAYVACSVWFWLATVCVMLVGAASAYRGDKIINLIHMTSAFMCVIFSHLAMCLDYRAYYISGISLTLSMLLMIFKNKILNGVWWAEIVTYLAIVNTIISDLIK